MCSTSVQQLAQSGEMVKPGYQPLYGSTASSRGMQVEDGEAGEGTAERRGSKGDSGCMLLMRAPNICIL